MKKKLKHLNFVTAVLLSYLSEKGLKFCAAVSSLKEEVGTGVLLSGRVLSLRCTKPCLNSKLCRTKTKFTTLNLIRFIEYIHLFTSSFKESQGRTVGIHFRYGVQTLLLEWRNNFQEVFTEALPRRNTQHWETKLHSIQSS